MTIISWKGQTFNEIATARVKNNPTNNNIFRANPLRIYRRTTKGTTNSEFNGTMTMDYPGAAHKTQSTDCVGISQTININLTENKSERPGSCVPCTKTTFSKEADARRRVRSSGMNSRKFFSSSKQYLDNRSKSYNRNQYYYIRSGDQSVKAGSGTAQNNVYASNNVSHCKNFEFTSDVSFNYTWISNLNPRPVPDNEPLQTFTVDIPAGKYNNSDINRIFTNTMINNKHYYIAKQGKNKLILMHLVYNSSTNRFEFTTTAASATIFNTTDYLIPEVETSTAQFDAFDSPANPTVPTISFSNIEFRNALGFTADPVVDPNTLVVSAANAPQSNPGYVPLYYKPNNYKFAQQGAVSSSDRITRLKYESITNSAASYANALGLAVANALAYGVPQGGYTLKDRLGYPNKCTPKSVNGIMRKCPSTKIMG